MFASYAKPRPHKPLLATPAIIPAQLLPWLQNNHITAISLDYLNYFIGNYVQMDDKFALC